MQISLDFAVWEKFSNVAVNLFQEENNHNI